MRNLSAEMIAVLNAKNKRPLLFYEGAFSTSTLNLWSGVGPIDWDGKTWIGAGKMASISPIEEGSTIKATGVQCSLSGLSPEHIQIAIAEVRQGKPGYIWVGFLTDDGQVVADPALAFEGRLDLSEIEDEPTAVNIILSYESRLRDLERARELRYTHESQQILYPGDKGFEYVPSLQDWNGKWGEA